MYEPALAMAREAGLEQYFMGHRQHAGFVGHGLGIEINEAPVIAPRSRDVLREGMCIALEPKFVIPGTGAVGIENTYVVRSEGPMECITGAPEEIIDLEK
ncbi:MAG: M24 family metallopeptidase, partial [Muribaculaceae bacterium]|nr:M24 family metallopeptidase [Muribaculaceae bacterium]